MSSKWLPGSDEFSPAKCAAGIRAGIRVGADDEERRTIKSLWEYHAEYLRVTAHGDPAKPSRMKSGAEVYWRWQAGTMAMFFVEVYGMALMLVDEDEKEMAKQTWRETDWDAMWDRLAAENRAYKQIA